MTGSPEDIGRAFMSTIDEFIIFVEEADGFIPTDPLQGMEQLALQNVGSAEPPMNPSDRNPLAEIDMDTLIRTGRQSNTLPPAASLPRVRSSSPSLRKALAKKQLETTEVAQPRADQELELNEEDLYSAPEISQVMPGPCAGAGRGDKENCVPDAREATTECSSSFGNSSDRDEYQRHSNSRQLGRSPLGAGAWLVDEDESTERTVTLYR